MFNLNYLKRLTLHGSRLVLRVVLIILPVIGHSLWEALKGVVTIHGGTIKDPTDRAPQPHEIDHPDWGIYWGNR